MTTGWQVEGRLRNQIDSFKKFRSDKNRLLDREMVQVKK